MEHITSAGIGSIGNALGENRHLLAWVFFSDSVFFMGLETHGAFVGAIRMIKSVYIESIRRHLPLHVPLLLDEAP